MRRYTYAEVSETQLEDLVRQAPELIEEGMRFVDHQVSTERGPLDILMVDSGGALVVAELKVVPDDGMLMQGLDYYDYVARNLDGFARAYSGKGINPCQEPRLLLIAPEFSPILLNRVKWLAFRPELFAFQVLEFADDSASFTPVYKEVTAPKVPERIETYSLDDIYNYITDPTIRALAKEMVSQVQVWDPDRVKVDPIQDAISIKRSGRVVAYLYPRRKFFHIGFYDVEGKWVAAKMSSKEDIDDGFMAALREKFDRVQIQKKGTA